MSKRLERCDVFGPKNAKTRRDLSAKPLGPRFLQVIMKNVLCSGSLGSEVWGNLLEPRLNHLFKGGNIAGHIVEVASAGAVLRHLQCVRCLAHTRGAIQAPRLRCAISEAHRWFRV